MLWHSMQSGGLWKLAQLTRSAAKHTRSLSSAVASGVIVSPKTSLMLSKLCSVHKCLIHEGDLLRFDMFGAGAEAAVRRMCS